MWNTRRIQKRGGRRGGDERAKARPKGRGGDAETIHTWLSSYMIRPVTSSASSLASMTKDGVGGFDVQLDRVGEDDGDVSGDVDGVESVDPEASEEGSGDLGGSSKVSGSSTSGAARATSVRVMKKYALLFEP